MSTSVVIEQPKKNSAELRNELAFLEQKIQSMKEEMRILDEKLTAKLEQKVKEKRAAFEKLETQKENMEKQLEELQENQEPSSSSNEPMSAVAERKEESPKQAIAVVAGMGACCGYCGTENIPNATFCEKCGKKLGSA